jgi:hypothetical protein
MKRVALSAQLAQPMCQRGVVLFEEGGSAFY